MRMGEEQALIPGLSDDIALDCLARVPHRYHAGLRPVCRSWRDLVTAPHFHRHRHRIGAAEDLVFLVQALADGLTPGEPKDEDKDSSVRKAPRAPVYALSVYNATRGEWGRGAVAAVPMFAQCAAVGGVVVVVGGWDPVTFAPVRSVRMLDPRTGEWRAGRPMPAPSRSLFACVAAGGRVYAAGGHDDGKNALRTVNAYDPSKDEWTELPPMAEERDECRGVALGGRFFAISGYGTESQGRFGPSAECYDPVAGKWSREEGVWGEEEQRGGGVAACFPAEGKLFYVDCGEGGRRGVREWENREWRTVGQVPEGLKPGACTAAMAGGRVFVMAAESGSGRGGHCGWVVDVKNKKWIRVETPPEFSGFVYSAATLRL